VAEYVCRLLAYMDARGYRQCVAVDNDPDMVKRPLMDFMAGYVLRSIDQLPKSGAKAPWRLGMNYAQDVFTLRYGRITDSAMRFSSPVPARRGDLHPVG
jgi:hypothetical protein